jgi:predicted DNA-binding WGR domain protein
MMITEDDIKNFGNEDCSYDFYGLNTKKLGEWNVIINTTTGHHKFWAWREGVNGLVRVRWGKIGTCGEEQQYSDEDEIRNRANAKLRKGYHIPTAKELEQMFGNNFVLWEL